MSPARRYKPPRSEALVILLGAVVGVIAVTAVTAAISAWLRIDDQVAQVERLAGEQRAALVENFRSRRAASLEGCRQREQLKDAIRDVLERFPEAAPNARRFPPVDCAAYARRSVPPTTIPGP